MTKRFTERLGIFTIIVGLLQAVLIGFQVFIARQQNRIMEKQTSIMDGQLRATEKSADAARAAAVTASRALYISERARISVTEVALKMAKNPPTCVVTIANNGGGKPAKVINCKVRCRNSPLPVKPTMESLIFPQSMFRLLRETAHP